MLGRLVRIVCTAFLGMALAFFVAVSGFADGSTRERALTIGLIVVAYGFIALTLGIWGSTWYGLGLAFPALVVLLFYAVSERNWRFVLYAALIVAVAMVAAYGGSRFNRRRGSAGVEFDALDALEG